MPVSRSERLIRLASSRQQPSHQANRSGSSERDPLLINSDLVDFNTEEAQVHHKSTSQAANLFSDLPVYSTVWAIRHKVLQCINDPYSLEQLRSPRMNAHVVRPLMQELFQMNDISVVFCLLVNKFQFNNELTAQPHSHSVNTSRALLCELLAQKILRQHDEESEGEHGLLLLTHILVCGFEPFQNCPKTVRDGQKQYNGWRYQDKGGLEMHMSALELAILTESKMFLSTAASQKVVDAIYVGKVIFTPISFIDILPDYYKRKPVSLYYPHKAPLFNQHRLMVPRTRNILEVCQFCVLLGLYMSVMLHKDLHRFNGLEAAFCAYSFGWILEQIASLLEHGWQVYSQNLWSFLDVTFCSIFIAYFGVRVHGLAVHNENISQLAVDILAMGAPVMVPRLAFNIFSENLVFLALRDMMSKFFLLTFLVVWTFAGFFLAMLWLGDGFEHPIDIAKWMVYVWFGLDGTGIQRSVEFHWFLGPALMVSFTVLGNTLFLTIVISTLSNSFARIVQHATAEIQYRRAVLVLEGVKADAIFAFQPPFNLLAVPLLLPLKFVFTPRWFHKINATISKVSNAPLLLLITWYERRTLWGDDSGASVPRKRLRNTLFNFTHHFHPAHAAIATVFANPPPESSSPKSDNQNETNAEENADALRDAPPSSCSSSSESSGSRNENDEESTAKASRSKSRSKSKSKSQSKHKHKHQIWENTSTESPFAGMLEDHESDSADTQKRLRNLEESARKIEKMLKRVCDSFDDKADEEAEAVEI